ncbi:hypothetical protein ACFSO0_00610 [Brevibacillus sp. GCM10020057]|uniref:hypothetical protein n=1 Tax=Brevibacillus sp. GCM10020057 TaxID=3317327 RepID=UPI00363459E7
MDIKKYTKQILDRLDSMNDEEFDQLLLDAGIEKCPFEESDSSYLGADELMINAYSYNTQKFSYSVEYKQTKTNQSYIIEGAPNNYKRGTYSTKNMYDSFSIPEVA